MRSLLAVSLVFFFQPLPQLAFAQRLPKPGVPEKLAAPASEHLILQAHATGFQIYACQSAPEQKPAWVLKAPDAELFDAIGTKIGTHFAGPTWKNNKDGSEVVGKMVAKQDAPDAGAIPWLLVTAVSHSGSGVFSTVTTVQRIHTKGGTPDASACDQAHLGAEAKIAYSADYYFYAPAH
jgi:hypothetical protein